MTWQARHEGSPKAVEGLTLAQIVDGIRDGLWELTDEIKGPGEIAWRHIEDHPQLAELMIEMEAEEPPQHEEGTHVDMNALIDVCMVLLIFFILTTAHATALQKIIPLPEIPTDAKKQAKVRKLTTSQVKKYMIRLHARGQVAAAPIVLLENKKVDVASENGKRIDGARLTDAIRLLVSGAVRKTEMVLKADNISWGEAVTIQDAAKRAGILKIHRLKN